ncbi:MAG: glycosyltransferase [Desulfovibrionaceae bacterium]
MPTVYYHLSAYVSHRNAGLLHKQALRTAGVPLTDNPQAADIVILHDDPLVYADLLAQNPHWAAVPKIAYAVWETENLPAPYHAALQAIDSIWTCSSFARDALAPAGKPVHVVPHVVKPPLPSGEDLRTVRAYLGECPPTSFFFYTIADSYNPRKNLMGLLEIYNAHCARYPHTYLVVKQYRANLNLSKLPWLISIEADLSTGQISALHQLCHCYVSAHHSEAWGLSLSDAMAHGKPVIATGYSGNQDFMTGDNSFPVNYRLEPVSALMCEVLPLFTPNMRWAQPDPNHMGYLLRKVRRTYPCATVTKKAQQSMRAYCPENIGALMCALLQNPCG